MVGKEVFDSQKRKADVPLGFEGESHRSNKVNFFHPRIATMSSGAYHATCNLPDVVEELSLELQEDQAPYNLDTAGDIRKPNHVTAIHETAYKETEWHITRIPKTSARLALPNKQLTKKKYKAKIV